jgi:hypothetical protein
MKMIIVPNKSLFKPCVPVLCEENADPEHPSLAVAYLMPCPDQESRACAYGRLCVALSCRPEKRSLSDTKDKENAVVADAVPDSAIGAQEEATSNPQAASGSNRPSLVLSCLYALPPQRRRLLDRLHRRSRRSGQDMACALLKREEGMKARWHGPSKGLNDPPQALKEEPPFPLELEGFRQALAEALHKEQEH